MHFEKNKLFQATETNLNFYKRLHSLKGEGEEREDTISHVIYQWPRLAHAQNDFSHFNAERISFPLDSRMDKITIF